MLQIMFKMDTHGNGILVEKSKLPQTMDLPPDVYSFDKFRYMCILSGCDYLPSLPGIGLGKANKLFKLTRQTDITMVWSFIRKIALCKQHVKQFFMACLCITKFPLSPATAQAANNPENVQPHSVSRLRWWFHQGQQHIPLPAGIWSHEKKAGTTEWVHSWSRPRWSSLCWTVSFQLSLWF